MATLFKPTRPYPLPKDAEIIHKDGKPYARVKDRGKWALYPLSEGGTQYLKPAAKWAADVRFADGRRKRVRFSANRDAAAVMLADLLKKIENEKSGIRDEYADYRKRALTELLGEYETHQADRGNTPKQAKQVRRRCEIVFDGCGFVQLSDLTGTAAERWLADRRQLVKKKGGLSPQTSNHYTVALKAFGNWLVKARRAVENPFRHLGRVNVHVDVRHVRRPLTADEFAHLLIAARTGNPFRGLSGSVRAMLYLVAGMTGLRASELASLTPSSFLLDADTPVVAVEAAYSKHRRRDEVPLHPELVVELRSWLADRKGGGPLWPGKWALHNEASDLIRFDLNTARRKWVAEAQTPKEKETREASSFLLYRDQDNRVADFHSLRHRFVTELVNAGVAPKDAKELARHSSITLTMDRYAHVGVKDTVAAVAKLNLPIAPRPDMESAAMSATGTDGGSSSGAAGGAATGDSRGVCLRIVEESTAASDPAESLEFQANDDGRGGVKTCEEVHPIGVEPITFGSVDRCSIQLSYGCSLSESYFPASYLSTLPNVEFTHTRKVQSFLQAVMHAF